MKRTILLLFFFATSVVHSQEHMGTPVMRFDNYVNSFGAFGGLYLGKELVGEVGFGVAVLDEGENLDFYGAGTSLEFNPSDDVYGIKIDLWKTLPIVPLNVGIGTVSYFQEGKFNQTIRPTIGLSYNYFRFSYAFDFLIGREHIHDLNIHQLFLRYYVPFHRKKRHQNILDEAE